MFIGKPEINPHDQYKAVPLRSGKHLELKIRRDNTLNVGVEEPETTKQSNEQVKDKSKAEDRK